MVVTVQATLVSDEAQQAGAEAPAGSQPSWEAVKNLVEQHAGWQASFREATAEERKHGRVFSIDVSYSAAAAASHAAAAPGTEGVYEDAAEGGQSVPGDANGASSFLLSPLGVSKLPFAPRQKQRPNLAQKAEDSPVRARVLQSFPPAVSAHATWGLNIALTAVGTLLPQSCDSSPPQSPYPPAENRARPSSSYLPGARQKLRIGDSTDCKRSSVTAAGAHGGWSGTREDRPARPDDDHSGSALWGGGGREFQVGNPTMTKAKFERAVPFALQGEEELRYIDAHPELARVPSDFQLFIIARQQKTRCHFSYWLQQRQDPDNIKHFKSLQELVLLLEEPAELYSKMATKDYYNPLAKAKFDTAIEFALQGEEERRYVEQHPILQRVPATHNLWIICKNVKNSEGVSSGKRVTFWMQLREDERVVKFYKGLLELGAALEGDYSPLRARFEQAQGQALTGAEEQEYLEQHPVLARVPAHHRLFIICRQSPGHTKSYNFWVQHRERPNELWYYRSLHELVDVLEGRAAEDDFSSASEVDEVKCKVAEEATAAAVAGGGGSNGKSVSKSKKGSGSSSNKEDGTGKKEYNHHARAHFDRAKAFALKGEERRRYIEEHPILARVPAGQRLHIVGRPRAPGQGSKYTFWLQDQDDEKIIKSFQNLHEVSDFLLDELKEVEQGTQAFEHGAHMLGRRVLVSRPAGAACDRGDCGSAGDGGGDAGQDQQEVQHAMIDCYDGDESYRLSFQDSNEQEWVQLPSDHVVLLLPDDNARSEHDAMQTEGGESSRGAVRKQSHAHKRGTEAQEASQTRENGQEEDGRAKKRSRNFVFSKAQSGDGRNGSGKKEYNHHARAHFDRARAFALEGEEEQKYLERNPVLARVPEDYRLYIIAKPFGDGNARRYTYYLQDRKDEKDVTPFKNLHDLATALDEGYSPLKARFETSLPFALQGAEEQEYMDQHPVLAKVPADEKLYVIARQSAGRTRAYSFWMQGPGGLRFFRSLHELIDTLDGISDNSEDEREQDVHTPGEGGLELQGVGMLANVSVCKKKGYNHHARAHFDRARAFALQGKEESEYLEQHPMLYKVPSEYRLWIISKMNKGEGRPRFTFWLQRKDDHKALQWYKGLQELYTSLWEFEDKTKCYERAGGEEKVEQGGGRRSEDPCANSRGVDRGGSRLGIESEESAAAGHGGEGGCAHDEEAGSAGRWHADETHEGRAADDGERVGQVMETAGDGDVRDLGLQVHPSWGRCQGLLKDNDEFILKGEEKEEYLRLHPEIASVPPTYTLFVVSKLVAVSATSQQMRRQYTFWLQQKKDPRVLKHYNSITELIAVLGPSQRKLTCKYCNKRFTNLQSHSNHERSCIGGGEGGAAGEQSEDGIVDGGQPEEIGKGGEKKTNFCPGDRVKVFWDGEGQWFYGVVEKTRREKGGQVRVRYEDDDEVHWEDSAHVRAAPLERAKLGRLPVQQANKVSRGRKRGRAAADLADDSREDLEAESTREVERVNGVGDGALSRPRDLLSGPEWVKVAREVLTRCQKHAKARPFMEPVDPETEGLDDYFQIIEDPMDFSTIANRLNKEIKDGGYSSYQRFAADMRLVFCNALAYNVADTHPVHKAAKILSAFFEDKWAAAFSCATP